MTKKKTRFRFKLSDFLVIIICLSITAGSLFLFWKDLNKSTTRTDKDAIATISFKYKIAQRKFDDRVVWERLQQNTSLYNLDTVRTADLAEAYITFKDGTVINLSENTMIQISYDEDGGVALNVNGGNITVDSTNSENQVSLQMDNGTKVNLEAGSRLEANLMGDGSEGAFVLQTGSGSIIPAVVEESTEKTSTTTTAEKSAASVITLAAGESAKVSDSGSVSRGAITVTSVGSDLRVLNFEEEKAIPVHLEWKASMDLADSTVIVETSKTKDFSVIENTYSETGSSSIDVPAEEGTLYWRVFAKDSEDAPIEGKVKVIDVKEVTPSSPVISSVYTYRTEPPVVQFGWNGNTYADHYKIEISSSPDFSAENILIDQDVSTERVSFSELEEGKYYWRVTPFYLVNSIGYATPTETMNFSIVKKQIAEPPKLSAPVDNAKIVHATNDFSTNFMWKSEVEKANYELFISKYEDFSDVVYSDTTESLRLKKEFNTSTLGDGKYYWKVVRSATEESDLSESEVRSFTIARYIPALNRLVFPPDNYSVEEARVGMTGFSWRLADEYKSTKVKTILQLSPYADFSSEVTEIDTTGVTEAKNLKLGSGNYFWRVGVLDPVKEDYVYTEERIFNVLKELENPVITYPTEDQIFVADGSAVVNMEWKEVEGADYYKVSAIDTNSGKVISEFNEVRGNIQRISLSPEAAGVNNYKLTVQAFALSSDTSGARSGRSSSVSFGIRGVHKIHLNYPVENQRIDGLTALRTPVTVQWEPDKDIPAASQFILRKIQSDGSVRVVQNINNPEQSIALDRLTEGTYQWTIKASTSDGVSLSDDIYRSFVVTSVPNLDNAVLVFPEDKFVMTAAYLKKNRNINFAWNSVPGATDYVFALYQRQKDGTLKRITGGSTGRLTNYKIRDLSILDIGDFEWQVTAYSHAPDGYEEQHSNVAVGHFTIDIKRPGRVKAKDPGRLYGE